MGGDRRDQGGDIGVAQTGERDAADVRVAVGAGEQIEQRVVGAQVDVAMRDHQQRTGGGWVPQQVTDGQQRRVVGPLLVVEQQDERSTPGRQFDPPSECVEQEHTLVVAPWAAVTAGAARRRDVA